GRPGANLQIAERARDARWRFQQRNGEWWYYSPESHWMYHREGHWNAYAADAAAPQPYATGYRGTAGINQQGQPQGNQPTAADQNSAGGGSAAKLQPQQQPQGQTAQTLQPQNQQVQPQQAQQFQ